MVHVYVDEVPGALHFEFHYAERAPENPSETMMGEFSTGGATQFLADLSEASVTVHDERA